MKAAGMTVQDWADLAGVYRAGAARARGWAYNQDRQQDAEILEAQAVQCEAIAWDRYGPPGCGKDPLRHAHVHEHDGARHAHFHSHPLDSKDHHHEHDGDDMSHRLPVETR